MREILFRAKRKDTQEWIEGYYGEYFGIPTIFQSSGTKCCEIATETVCEFIGICDITGKRIYEGDILQALNGHIGYVVFEYGSFKKVCYCHPDSRGDIYGDNETVIGNIFDSKLKSDE